MLCCTYSLCFFFFKQKTAYDMRISDWSSDVCSSDLFVGEQHDRRRHPPQPVGEMRVERRHPGAGVDQHQHEVGLLDRLLGLPPHPCLETVVEGVLEPGGVDQPELQVGEIGRAHV